MPASDALHPNEAALADLLARLRLETRQQSGLAAHLVPTSTERAYRIAERVRETLQWAPGGWKVAAFKPEMQRALRADAPIYGRVYAPHIHPAPLRLSCRALLHPLVEAEIVVSLGSALPPRPALYTEDEVARAVASVHLGIEVPECRFVADAVFPPLPAILADGSGSGHLAKGAAIDTWRDVDWAAVTAVVTVNGRERRRGSVTDALGHPLAPVTWLANTLSQWGIGLQAGEVVSTGTLTGMVRALPGETHVATFSGLGEVSVEFVP